MMLEISSARGSHCFELVADHTTMRLIAEGLRELKSEQARDLANTIRDALVRWPKLPEPPEFITHIS